MTEFSSFKTEYKEKNLNTLKESFVEGSVFDSYVDKNLKYRVKSVSGERVTVAQVTRTGEGKSSCYSKDTLAKLLFNKNL